MHATVRNMIESNIELIDSNDFHKFYDMIAGYHNYIPRATDALYNAGLDPLQYMNYIPQHFRSGSTCESIYIPQQIRVIHANAFATCHNLKEVTGLSTSNVVEIGASAFAFCDRLQHIELPESLERIGNGAFIMCKNLKEITIKGITKELGGHQVFRSCPDNMIVNLSRHNKVVLEMLEGMLHYKDFEIRYYD